MILGINGDYFPTIINQLVFVMERRCVFREMGAKFINIMKASFKYPRVTKQDHYMD
jgi:hypothetical protein